MVDTIFQAQRELPKGDVSNRLGVTGVYEPEMRENEKEIRLVFGCKELQTIKCQIEESQGWCYDE